MGYQKIAVSNQGERGTVNADMSLHVPDKVIIPFIFLTPPAIGVKPVSSEGTKRLVRRALQYASDQDRDSVTLVQKGDIMKCTEGAFKNGDERAREEFGQAIIDNMA